MDNSHISKFKLFFSLDKELAYIKKAGSSSISRAELFIHLKNPSRTSILPYFTPQQRKRFWKYPLLPLSAATKPYRIRWTVSVICCISPAERQMFRLNLFVKHLKKLTAQKEYIIVSELSALFLSYCPFYLFWIVRLSFGQG